MCTNTGGEKYDAKKELKKKTQKELFALRDKFSLFCANHGTCSYQFLNYLNLIKLEISSRIGKK